MKEFAIEGQFWFAGDRLFIDEEDKFVKGAYNVICLNDLMKSIKEESKVRIVISFEE